MIALRMVLLPLLIIFLSQCTSSQKGNSSSPAVHKAANTDTTKKDSNSFIVYKELITGKARTDSGLFLIHSQNQRYYFEIPDTLFDRDILCVNRISKAAANIRPQEGFLGYSGDNIGESVIRFSKGPVNKVYIKRISYLETAKDSSETSLYRSIANSNFQPIVVAFDIKTVNPDSTSTVIDVTDLLNTDNDVLFFSMESKKNFNIGGFHADKSYVESVHSYPLNIEIRSVKTYTIGESFSTYELNSSLVLLPVTPMKARMTDDRVGYFGVNMVDYDGDRSVKLNSMATRWKLEPQPEDVDKYLKGELVVPRKPIVYYIDPATPKMWVPYLIQGVNDWQKAFEKAGFINAIYAIEAPVNDPEWSLYDARHSAIIYKPSAVSNASGPHVHDPRSGEILEAHVNWYHNVIDLIYKWYFIQVAPNDTSAQKPKISDELMGTLIRFVCTHEIGHTLGLTHNFGASSTVPVDSLRSRHYTEENGFCPSIMDYARFNYVAQPEDRIPLKGLLPRIGVYDEWAIEWGYRWFPETHSKEAEKTYMNSWVTEKLNKDNRLWFATNTIGSTDPRNQAEDLGDNAMKAGRYGINNLKRILPNLIDWTYEPNSDYKNAEVLQKQVYTQFFNYLRFVAANIGGKQENSLTREQKGVIWKTPGRDVQRSAVRFLQEELFTTPEWLLNGKLFPYTGVGSPASIADLQKFILFDIMSRDNFKLLSLFARYSPENSYSYDELLDDLEAGIWKELKTTAPIEELRRNLQKAYAERLIRLMETDPVPPVIGFLQQPYIQTDLYSIVKGHIEKLRLAINTAIPKQKDKLSKWHLIDLSQRLSESVGKKPDVAASPLQEPPKSSAIHIEKKKFGCFDFITDTLPVQPLKN